MQNTQNWCMHKARPLAFNIFRITSSCNRECVRYSVTMATRNIVFTQIRKEERNLTLICWYYTNSRDTGFDGRSPHSSPRCIIPVFYIGQIPFNRHGELIFCRNCEHGSGERIFVAARFRIDSGNFVINNNTRDNSHNTYPDWI